MESDYRGSDRRGRKMREKKEKTERKVEQETKYKGKDEKVRLQGDVDETVPVRLRIK